MNKNILQFFIKTYLILLFFIQHISASKFIRIRKLLHYITAILLILLFTCSLYKTGYS
jgi:hypothetical protein